MATGSLFRSYIRFPSSFPSRFPRQHTSWPQTKQAFPTGQYRSDSLLFGDVDPAAAALTLGAPARLAPQASAYAASDTDEAGPAGPDPTEHEAALRAWGVAAVVCLGPNRCCLHLALRNRLEKNVHHF